MSLCDLLLRADQLCPAGVQTGLGGLWPQLNKLLHSIFKVCGRNSVALGKPVASLMLGCVVGPKSRLGSQCGPGTAAWGTLGIAGNLHLSQSEAELVPAGRELHADAFSGRAELGGEDLASCREQRRAGQ